MELWLIRHPRPLVEPRVCYGRLDLAVGEAELAAVANRLLPSLPPGHRLRTSPASRCLALARRLHQTPVEDERLLERSFGEWEGLAWDAIGAGALDAWAEDPWDFAPPGGESARALLARVVMAVSEETVAGGVAVWVTHQGVARAAAGMLMALPADAWMNLQLPFGGAWQLTEQGGRWQKEDIAAGD
jgi:alpha-ribazole phosphatase